MDDWRVLVGVAVMIAVVVTVGVVQLRVLFMRFTLTALKIEADRDVKIAEAESINRQPPMLQTLTVSPHNQYQVTGTLERALAQQASGTIVDVPPPALPGVTTLGQVRAMGWQPTLETVLQAVGPGGQLYTTPAKRAMHLLFAAPTGDGKTNIMLLYALQFIRLGYAVYLLDLKFRPYHDDTGIDWGRVAAATPPGRAYTEPGEILDFLEWVATVELERRRKLFNQGAPLSALGQPMYLFVEEALVLAGLDKARPVMQWIGKIMQLGRELGIFVAMAVQGALIKALGGSITDQAQTRTRYCGVDVDTTTKMRLLELKSLDSLPPYDPQSVGPGVLWLWSDGTARRPTLVRVPLVTAADLEAMLAASPAPSQVIDGHAWAASPPPSPPPPGEAPNPAGEGREGLSARAQVVRELVRAGTPSSQIIQQVWGVSGGKGYQTAAQELTGILAQLV